MNWTMVLTEEARRNCLALTDTLARKHALSEHVVRNALRRYESQGLVERVSTKIYINHFNQQLSQQDLVNVFRPRSYVSLESAMVERGIISQTPSALICVTPVSAHSQRASYGFVGRNSNHEPQVTSIQLLVDEKR